MINPSRFMKVAFLVWIAATALPDLLSATGPIASRDTRPSLYDRNRRDRDRRDNSNRRQTSSRYMPTSPYYSSGSSS